MCHTSNVSVNNRTSMMVASEPMTNPTAGRIRWRGIRSVMAPANKARMLAAIRAEPASPTRNGEAALRSFSNIINRMKMCCLAVRTRFGAHRYYGTSTAACLTLMYITRMSTISHHEYVLTRDRYGASEPGRRGVGRHELGMTICRYSYLRCVFGGGLIGPNRTATIR